MTSVSEELSPLSGHSLRDLFRSFFLNLCVGGDGDGTLICVRWVSLKESFTSFFFCLVPLRLALGNVVKRGHVSEKSQECRLVITLEYI